MAHPTVKPARRSQQLPRLSNGQRLTRDEFERRYDAMPELKKAELIEGVVYMPSPVRQKQHGGPVVPQPADEDMFHLDGTPARAEMRAIESRTGSLCGRRSRSDRSLCRSHFDRPAGLEAARKSDQLKADCPKRVGWDPRATMAKGNDTGILPGPAA